VGVIFKSSIADSMTYTGKVKMKIISTLLIAFVEVNEYKKTVQLSIAFSVVLCEWAPKSYSKLASR
jgi:hypothetical protein